MSTYVMAEKPGEEYREKAGEHGAQQEKQQLLEQVGGGPFFSGQYLLLHVSSMHFLPRAGGEGALSNIQQ